MQQEPAGVGWGNLSGTERVARTLAGAAMLAAAWSGVVSGIAGVALQVFGWVPLATGIVGWCPFYAILGISSRRRGVRAGGRRGRTAAHQRSSRWSR